MPDNLKILEAKTFFKNLISERVVDIPELHLAKYLNDRNISRIEDIRSTDWAYFFDFKSIGGGCISILRICMLAKPTNFTLNRTMVKIDTFRGKNSSKKFVKWFSVAKIPWKITTLKWRSEIR